MTSVKNNRSIILNKLTDAQDRITAAKLLDKLEFSEKTNKPAHSEFLDPKQQMLAEKVLKSAGSSGFSFFGGYAGAERSIVLFIPEVIQEDDRQDYINSLLKVIEITSPAGYGLTHRDYLGSLMGLGIRREITGDILVSDEKCSIIILADIAQYVAGNLRKVGNTGVDLKITDINQLSVPEIETVDKRAVVAALRLDCVCASAFGLSRSKAAEYIKNGMVKLNWDIIQNTDKSVKQGDTLSLRGKGRAVLEEVGAKTKKDRIGIIIRKYI